MKSNFEARPQFFRAPSRIQRHFVISYLALVIQGYLEDLLREEKPELSTIDIQDSLHRANVSVFCQEKVP